MMPRMYAPRPISGWTPPQLESLVGAWVSGLSGNVAKLGSWAGQYETTPAMTLYADAEVTESGLILDGTGDYAKTPTPVTTAVANVTIAVWSRLTDKAIMRQCLLENGNGANNGYSLIVNTEFEYTGRLRALYGGKRWFTTSQIVASGQWFHAALVINASSHATVYYNNSIVYTEVSGTAPHPATGSTGIGVSYVYNLTKGAIDTAYVWNAALTAAEIADVFNNDPHKRMVGT